jgi:transcriptional regulator NrdR family protein
MKGAKYCPVCGRKQSQILDTRVMFWGNVYRRRICPACKYRWSTIEVLYEPEKRKKKWA